MSFYKYFSEHDRVVSTNPLYEVVDLNVKTLFSSSNSPYNFTQYASGGINYATSEHLFDLTFGRTTGSVNLQNNIYNQFSKGLLGHNPDSSVKKFKLLEDVDKPVGLPEDLPYAFIINLARSQTNDRIKQGSVNIQLSASNGSNIISLIDSGSYIHEGAGGHHYGVLSATSSVANLLTSSVSTGSVGYVFYEAGIAVVSPYIFTDNHSNYVLSTFTSNSCGILSEGKQTFGAQLTSLVNGTSIEDLNSFMASKLVKISYTSVTELNSTIYFCRAYNHEFNYSSNPTYLKDSEIIVKNGDPEEPSRAYITTVGLYSDDNQLLAVAKLSEPILKTKENELIARVRLDF